MCIVGTSFSIVLKCEWLALCQFSLIKKKLFDFCMYESNNEENMFNICFKSQFKSRPCGKKASYF